MVKRASGSKKTGSPKARSPRGLAVFDPNPSGRLAAEVLRALAVDGAVVGRVAVLAWLPDPSDHAYTKDVDVAVALADLPKVRSWLAEHELEIQELPIGGVNAGRAGGINVDFITCNGELGTLSPLFEDAIQAAQRSRKSLTIGGKKLPLVPAEHLVAMKIATMERKDQEDAERLLEVAKVDIPKLRALVERFLAPLGPARLEVILREIGHPAARPRRKYDRAKR